MIYFKNNNHDVSGVSFIKVSSLAVTDLNVA